ncbi:DUF2730 family protein [Halomonas sp. BMC6]|jgi:hypothetical protein|uniref:DUF2730 family protein n=1 Tax=Halomonas sp. BMC6 TaxID=3073244 RepID=UPI0030D575E2
MELFNWNAAKVIFDVMQALLTALMAAYVYWLNKHRASQAAIKGTNDRIDGVERKVVNLEHKVERLPDHEDIEKLQEQMARTNVLLAEISANQKSTSVQVNRINDYLLNQGGRS